MIIIPLSQLLKTRNPRSESLSAQETRSLHSILEVTGQQDWLLDKEEIMFI